MPQIVPVDKYEGLLPLGWHALDEAPSGRGIFKRSMSIHTHFKCSKCTRKWSSHKGRATFFFQRPSFGGVSIYCEVFAQDCKKCERTFIPTLDDASWHDTVTEVIEQYIDPSLRPDRPAGAHDPTRPPHDSKRCEACKLGVCGLAFKGEVDSLSTVMAGLRFV
eukprot:TRINITY_DN8001_c0_g1_i1.p1 TRINITY_DN8001_c0_g1~~TRINITY_DN8001_c0_g1_i1.p1  ORF type:complete len:163 (+),score=9.19 TRINITY_DN8001_c0_g1_i1:121-609(+)